MAAQKKDKRSGDFKEYLIGELKKDPEFAAEYLNSAIEDGDPRVFLLALGDLTKAKGMSALSKKTGLNRENIYRIVSTNGNPQIKSVFALFEALGLQLRAEPKARKRKQSPKKMIGENIVVFEERAKAIRNRKASTIPEVKEKEVDLARKLSPLMAQAS